MRELVKDFVKICAETLPVLEPVYEFGALQVPGQEGYADLRPFFKGKKYIGADMQEGPGVDVVLNMHNIELPPETAGTVLALDTLEHVEYVRKAVDEVYRILTPDGIFIATSVMNFRIHAWPHDYWRFTPEGFKSLLKPFAHSIVEFAGDRRFPHTVVGVGFKSPVEDKKLEEFYKRLKQWKDYWSVYAEKGLKGRLKHLSKKLFG